MQMSIAAAATILVLLSLGGTSSFVINGVVKLPSSYRWETTETPLLHAKLADWFRCEMILYGNVVPRNKDPRHFKYDSDIIRACQRCLKKCPSCARPLIQLISLLKSSLSAQCVVGMQP